MRKITWSAWDFVAGVGIGLLVGILLADAVLWTISATTLSVIASIGSLVGIIILARHCKKQKGG